MPRKNIATKSRLFQLRKMQKLIRPCRHGRYCARCCHPWQGNIDPNGYSSIWFQGKTYTVHRLFYILIHDVSLTRAQYICHTCNNKACCNPHHLYCGDARTNAIDRVKQYASRTPMYRRTRQLVILTGEMHKKAQRLFHSPLSQLPSTEPRRRRKPPVKKRMFLGTYL